MGKQTHDGLHDGLDNWPEHVGKMQQQANDIKTKGDESVMPTLTKREYFAAMAMQGIISSMNPGSADPHLFNLTAKESVGYADALIEALNQTNKP